MFRLKTLTILGSKAELSTLPEGKLLINTINAHSYNTALKDTLFAEALSCGDVLIPDGVSIVKACRWIGAKSQPRERIAGWDLFDYEMNRLERESEASTAKGESPKTVIFMGSSQKVLDMIVKRAAEVQGSHLFTPLQARVHRRGQPRHHHRHPCLQSRPAVDRHDRSEAREVDLFPLVRA